MGLRPRDMKKKHALVSLCLMIVVVLLLSACSNQPGIEKSDVGSLTGTVLVNQEPEFGVKVTLPELDLEDTTDENGVYSFTEIPNGNYTLYFWKDIEGVLYTKEQPVLVNGDDQLVDPIELQPKGENSLEEAKGFTDAISSNNIQLINNVQGQMQAINTYMESDVGPYMQSLLIKVTYGVNIIGMWFDASGSYPEYWLSQGEPGIIVGTMLAPGGYTYDPEIGLVQNETYPVDPALVDTWEWDFELNDYYFAETVDTISISVTNLDQVVTYDAANGKILEIDLSQANFSYIQTMDNDPNKYKLEFDYSLISDSSQTIEGNGEVPDTGEEYKYDIIIPDLGEISMSGLLTDNIKFIVDDVTYEPTGNVSIDGILNFDINSSSSSKYVTYEGTFNSDLLSTNSNIDVEFYSFPSYSDIVEGNGLPVMSSISSDGTLDMGFLTINGNWAIEFSEQYNYVPTYISLGGSYSCNLLRDQEPVNINYLGDLTITPDYSNYDFINYDDESNYIGGQISFRGNYQETDFGTTALNFVLNRTSYSGYDISADYGFGEGKFINSDIVLNGNEVNAQAYNQSGIRLNMAFDNSKNYQEPVGEITNYNGTERYADILYNDKQIQVNWSDFEVTSLLY